MQASDKSTESVNVAASSTARPARPSVHPLLSIGQAAEKIGVTVDTLRVWTNNGKFPCVKSLGGHRRYRVEDCLAYLGLDESDNCEDGIPSIMLIARVSSAKQSKGYKSGGESDLTRQEARLWKWANETYPESVQAGKVKMYSRTASGMNFENSVFLSIVNDLLDGQFQIVACVHPERICRFGFGLVKELAKRGGAEIIVIADGESEKTEYETLADDILAVMTHFSAKTYGKRAAETNRRHISTECLERMIELRQQNMAIQQIIRTLNEEGFKQGTIENPESEPITEWIVSRFLTGNGIEKTLTSVVNLKHQKPIESDNQAPIDRFIAERIIKTDDRKDKILLAEFGKAYGEWCVNNGLVVECRETIGILLNTRNLGRCRVNGRRMLYGVKLA